MLKFTCPPQKPSGAGTFSNNLVGNQLTQGGGLTLGNFVFTGLPTEKVNRNFDTGVFSGPFTLDNMNISSVEEARKIFDTNFKVYPNFDNTDVLNFVGYGSLSKRFESSITNIINFFPAGFEATVLRSNYTTGQTITSVTNYLGQGIEGSDYCVVNINVSILKNSFGVDYSQYSTQNISNLGYEVSKYRDFVKNFRNYVLITTGGTYQIYDVIPSTSLTAGTLSLSVEGTPFGTSSINYFLEYLVRPNDFTVNQVFNLELDEVDEILLNRFTNPIYTATFQTPSMLDSGEIVINNTNVSFPLNGQWNLDIGSVQFTNYINKLQEIALNNDETDTNLIERFYTTDSLKEFDTSDQKVSKILKIYGRSFDDSKKYIDAISHQVSVNYNVKNDIASAFLPNLAKTLGWLTNISPIQSSDFLDTLYQSYDSSFSGLSESYPLEELQNQYYRNLLLNSAYIFKSKGTRKSVEFLLKFIGAPDALVQFNEKIYLVDNKIPLSRFDELYLTIAGGTYSPTIPAYDPSNVYRFFGTYYTGYTSSTFTEDVSVSRLDFPVDSEGYPTAPRETDTMFFQKGAGWFEPTVQHTSPEVVNPINSTTTGQSVNIQTSLEPFSYGQKYLDIFRKFPYLETGFGLRIMDDNKKSWTDFQVGIRKNSDATFDAYYEVSDDRLVLNVKNVDLFMNPGQALEYNIWYLSNEFNYPIPFSGLSSPFPQTGGTDWTFINPKPQIEDFFEFARTFWQNMINTRNRQQSSDGKTSGYPTLQLLFWKYLTMYNDVGIQNNNFSYETMMDYVNSLGDYWVRLVEQVIPATTIWNTGTRFENSIFHRQKFVYRPQRGCVTVESDVLGPQAAGVILPNNCGNTDVTLDLAYNLNLIQISLSNLVNSSNLCSPTQTPYVTSLKYTYLLNISKGGQNYEFIYTNPTTFSNPSMIIIESVWNLDIETFLNLQTVALNEIGIVVNQTLFNQTGTVFFDSVDCERIDIIEFNLEFTNVVINCF
jgi:hypothetical protein